MASSENPTIFHITHWKAGSQWIRKILSDCVPNLIVEPQVYVAHFLSSPIQKGKVYPTVYVTKEQFENVQMPVNWRRFVIIRDLRDTLISAYFSIKVSHRLSGSEIALWREKLNSLSIDEGLTYLMDEWLPRCARIQESWVNGSEEIIRYEDLLTDDMMFERILIDQCGLDVAADKLHKAIIANRFESLTGRKRGEEQFDTHVRKGIQGDWKNYFTENVKKAFKTQYGELLMKTGYESGPDW